MGSPAGSRKELHEALQFAASHGVRPRLTQFPLAAAAEALAGTQWKGVTIGALLEAAGLEPPTRYVTAFCDGGYTTNLALEDLLGGRGLVVYEYDGAPIEPEHGGPARLLVPHLYFWKSAKWVRGLAFMERNEPGFWETRGYHLRGDPWKEERYSGN